MIRIVKSEMLKLKHGFPGKLVWLSPLLALTFGVFFTNNTRFGHGAQFFWYIIILPISVSLFCGAIVSNERQQRFATVLCVPFSPWRIGCGKMLVSILFILIGCAIFSAFASLCSKVIANWQKLAFSWQGSIMMLAAFLWRIPFSMLLTAKAGLFALIALDLPLTVVAGLIADRVNIFPFSIPGKILLSEGHSYWSYISLADRAPLPAVEVGVSLVLFIALATLFGWWLNRQEVQ